MAFDFFDIAYTGHVTGHTTEPKTVLPPSDLEGMLDLSRFLEQVTSDAVLVGPDGEQVDLPKAVFDILKAVADAMQEGKAITVAPVSQQLTTQQAADFLGISRPTFVKLLEEGRIPFERPGAGRHRKVRLDDVLNHKAATSRARLQTLDELSRSAQVAGLYDATPATYEEALHEARKQPRG